MEEKVFFEKQGIIVTQSRFVYGAETYAVRNITSVKPKEIPPSNGWSIVLILVGLLFLSAYPNPVYWIGLVLILVNGLRIYSGKTTYVVQLSTSGGEVPAFKSHDKELVLDIITALNNAIIYRG
jgi:hypothetical protein